jgi:HSP20 family protein
MYLVPVSRRAASRVRLFDDALQSLFNPAAASDAAPVRRPAVDVAETDAGYVVTLDVPGVSREDVKVSIDGRRVAIVAEARAAAPEAADATAEGDAPKAAERFIVRERAAASFARSFTLQSEIDQTASAAKLDNGVLTLTLTKRAPTASQLTVN